MHGTNSPVIEGEARETILQPGTVASVIQRMEDDPNLMVDALADVLDAAANVFYGSEESETLQFLGGCVREIDPPTLVFIEFLVDAYHRQQAMFRCSPFIQWLEGQATDDPLVELLLRSARRKPAPCTFLEYRSYLMDLHTNGTIGDAEVDRFCRLWDQYLSDGSPYVGDVHTTRTEWQYGVEVRWPDGSAQRPDDTENGIDRLRAEALAMRLSLQDEHRTAVVQRRLSVHGPWVDMSCLG